MATDVGAKGTLRVVVVVENDLVRRGLVDWLKREPDMEVVAQAHDGTSAHSEVLRTGPDVVLVNVQTSPFEDHLFPDLSAGAASPRGGPMDLFTGKARRAVVLAQEEARLLHHDYIGTEHLLLGVLREGDAAIALESLGISFERVRQQVEETVGAGQSSPRATARLPPTQERCWSSVFARLSSSATATSIPSTSCSVSYVRARASPLGYSSSSEPT